MSLQVRHIVLLCIIALASAVSLAKVKTVEATYVYHAPSTQSPEEAMRVALERAQLQAIADEFGTVISQENTTRIDNSSAHSGTSFFSLSTSDVKGEWVETIGKPECKIEFTDGMMVVTVRVKGKAREIVTAPVSFIAETLRNHPDRADATTDFRAGNDMYLYFRSPIDGYLAVYLLPGDDEAYRLLPYRRTADGVYCVEANRDYTFFSIDQANIAEKNLTDEYVLTASQAVEHNVLYVLFSKQRFYNAVDQSNGETTPCSLSEAEFLKWLGKSRAHDSEMQVKKFLLTITK